MGTNLAEVMDLKLHQGAAYPTNVCVGQIVSISGEGKIIVDCQMDRLGPREARFIDGLFCDFDGHGSEGKPVLMIFEHHDPALPIIVGVIRDSLTLKKEEILDLKRPKDALVDGKRVVLKASDEIMLRCGKSSLLLRKDGKVVVKGTQITTRSAGSNKIKGASVSIN